MSETCRMSDIKDGFGRHIDYARISVTDRCNYRCLYCMPETGVPAISHESIMRYEEIMFLCEVLWELGIKKVRFTGGEPLVRKGLVPFLLDLRKKIPPLSISLTSNASLLSDYSKDLARVGLSGMNISLDTLDPGKFRTITRIGDIEAVFSGIQAAQNAGIGNIKTNTVLIRGFNEQELPYIVEYAWNRNILPRFIEFMPLADDVWNEKKFIPASEILEMLQAYGVWRMVAAKESSGMGVPAGPACYYENMRTGRTVGVIAAVSNHFCDCCNRLRITATGNMRACLFSSHETALLAFLRNRDKEKVKEAILKGIYMKPENWERIKDGNIQMSDIGG